MDKKLLYINRAIDWCIYSVVFFVPLYFSFLYVDFSVFSLDKTVLFRILVEILFALTVLKIFWQKKICFYVDKKSLFVMAPFLVFLVISSFFSFDFYTSFWGTYWRFQGLFTYLHYVLFFLILVVNVDSREKIEKIINFIILSSFFVAFYGVFQWLGLDFFSWYEKVSIGGRIFSTIGQPVLLGNYLLLVLFLTFYKILVTKTRLKLFFIISFFLQFLALIFTLSRGSWLGFIFGFSVFAFYYFWAIKKKRKIFVFIIFSLIILFVSIFFVVKNVRGNIVDYGSVFNVVLNRVESLGDLKSGSIAIRFLYWKAGVKAISENVLFGYGLENQHHVLIEHYLPDWSLYETINSSPDRLHCELLEFLFSGGIFLFLSYLLLVGYIIYVAWKKTFKNGKSDKLLFALLLSYISYQVALLTSFSLVETNIFFVLFSAFILIITNDFYQKEIKIETKDYIKNLLLVFVFLLVVYLVIFVNINSVRADVSFKKARKSFSQNKQIDMFDNYLTAISLNPRQPYYQWFFISDSLSSLRSIESSGYRKKVLELSLEMVNDFNDNLFENKLMKAKTYSLYGKYVDKNFFPLASQVYQELSQISPYYPAVYEGWALMQFEKGDYEQAVKVYNQALHILPEYNSYDFQNEHIVSLNSFVIDVYKGLFFSYKEIGNYEKQEEFLKKILSINPNSEFSFFYLSELYVKNDENKKALEILKKASSVSLNEIWPLKMAEIYYRNGENEKALFYAESAAKLSPQNADTLNFINKVKKESDL